MKVQVKVTVEGYGDDPMEFQAKVVKALSDSKDQLRITEIAARKTAAK